MSDWQFTEQHYEMLMKEISEIRAQLQTANGRTRKLENWRNYLLGAWAVLSFFALVMYEQLKSLLESIASLKP